MNLSEHTSRRKFGQHFTSRSIFYDYIQPMIQNCLDQFIFVDMFCGSGNLILPILELIPEAERISFFEENIYLFDVQEKWISDTIKNAQLLGIPLEIAKKNIELRDSLRKYPQFLLKKQKPVFHITNPPYLYLGYITKHLETQKYLDLFQGENQGYQDLYQLALMNDLRNHLSQMIYIIPSNFIFGNSVSNKIRNDFFEQYTITESYIFETKIFEHTGQNVMINYFNHHKTPKKGIISFMGKKILKDSDGEMLKQYTLYPEYNYKAGSEFEQFVDQYKHPNPIEFQYYLKIQEVNANKGNIRVSVIDSNKYLGNEYQIKTISVTKSLAQKIQTNILWIRTVDTGTWEGRAGLYQIPESFGVEGILVSKNTYRTNPIQLFFEPSLSKDEQTLLMEYFNFVLEHLRTLSDSEFMTTYKYSNGPYTRKYFGLSQAKKIIQTFPRIQNEDKRKELSEIILNRKDIKELCTFLNSIKNNRDDGKEIKKKRK